MAAFWLALRCVACFPARPYADQPTTYRSRARYRPAATRTATSRPPCRSPTTTAILPPQALLAEVLPMTKMNWNSARFTEKLSVTVRFQRSRHHPRGSHRRLHATGTICLLHARCRPSHRQYCMARIKVSPADLPLIRGLSPTAGPSSMRLRARLTCIRADKEVAAGGLHRVCGGDTVQVMRPPRRKSTQNTCGVYGEDTQIQTSGGYACGLSPEGGHALCPRALRVRGSCRR